jgi:hypothetical protein
MHVSIYTTLTRTLIHMEEIDHSSATQTRVVIMPWINYYFFTAGITISLGTYRHRPELNKAEEHTRAHRSVTGRAVLVTRTVLVPAAATTTASASAASAITCAAAIAAAVVVPPAASASAAVVVVPRATVVVVVPGPAVVVVVARTAVVVAPASATAVPAVIVPAVASAATSNGLV